MMGKLQLSFLSLPCNPVWPTNGSCGSIGESWVFILSTFLAFQFSSLMNNYHMVLYVFQNFEHISTILTTEACLVVDVLITSA